MTSAEIGRIAWGNSGVPGLEQYLRTRTPILWCNPRCEPIDVARTRLPLTLDDVLEADRHIRRFAEPLRTLFPELEGSGGLIESPLLGAKRLQRAMAGESASSGQWFIKADHALPIAGSIKARGGIYEVLAHAESLALRTGLLNPDDDRSKLISPEARVLFARHRVAVGSTGNLGLGIGVMAAALGFRATVHMSAEAKPWKKARLRARGVEVVEHDGDYGAAVVMGREQSRHDPNAYFVDDEHSEALFLGYSVAALRLQQQLNAIGVEVDAQHPLFVYLPCGVGGAPGGIAFGLRHVFGDQVHCFFAEPVASPCMLLRLASAEERPIHIRELGLDNRTEADGLAVAQASELVAPLMQPLLSGICTVRDEELFEDLYTLEQSEGLRIEPSAAAGFRGPLWLVESDAGRGYQAAHGLSAHMGEATHVLWTTGGLFVPDEEHRKFHERGRLAIAARKSIAER